MRTSSALRRNSNATAPLSSSASVLGRERKRPEATTPCEFQIKPLALRRSRAPTIGRGRRLRILLILVAMGTRLALSTLAMVMSGLALAVSSAAAGDRLTATERAALMKAASQAG